MLFKVACLDGRFGEGTAACESAAAAVRAGHSLFDLIDARVFLNLELFGHKEEDERKQDTENGDDGNGPDNNIGHNYSDWIVNTYSFCNFSRKKYRAR